MSTTGVETVGTGWPSFARARDAAIGRLSGRVLEIGAGSGANFAALRPGVTWVGLEPSARLRRQLTATAARYGHDRPPLAAAAEQIPLPDGSVDAVLATTVLCSVQDPARVLTEAARVLVPGGRLVLAEHVAAARGTGVRMLQRAVRPVTRALDHGCDPTRETEAIVRAGGWLVHHLHRVRVPVLGALAVPFLVLEATPPAASGRS